MNTIVKLGRAAIYFFISFVLENFAMAIVKDRILVIGASGQIGVELTMALRKKHGNNNVIASDLREENPLLKGTGPYVSLDVMNKDMLHVQVIRQNITQIYLLAAILSATGEKNPNLAWHLNMQGLLNVLDIAREEKLHKVYWPSSIAVFGPSSPKKNCPQQTIIEPSTVYGISKYAGEFWCNYYHRQILQCVAQYKSFPENRGSEMWLAGSERRIGGAS